MKKNSRLPLKVSELVPSRLKTSVMLDVLKTGDANGKVRKRIDKRQDGLIIHIEGFP